MKKDSQYDYLNIFSDFFFDVDSVENRTVKEIIGQVDIVLSSLIVRFGEVENELICIEEEKQTEEVNFDKSRTNLVIMTLVRKIMEQLDAINILYSKCCFSQAQVILRSMVENVVSLEFILGDDTDLRATSYFMEHYYQEIEKAREYFSDDSPLKGNIPDLEFEKAKENLENKENAIKNLVTQNALIGQVDLKRKSILDGKRIKRISWYEISGPRNFYGLMKAVGLGEYYTGIYGGLSFETHALNATKEMRFNNDGSVCINRIRSPHDGGSIFSLSCMFAISALNMLYEYLGDGPDEKAEFREYFEWYQRSRENVVKNLDRIALG